MRIILLTFAILIGLVPAVAWSQDFPPPAFSIPAADLKDYCIFNSKVFSQGTFICTARKVSIQCVGSFVYEIIKDGSIVPTTASSNAAAHWQPVITEECEQNPGKMPE
jgi:hypothetical protein